MKPKRLGDFAQAKREERNETVPRGPGLRGLDDSRWKTKKNVLREVNIENIS